MEGEDFAQSAHIFNSLPKRNSFFKNELNYGLGSLKTSGRSFNCYSGEESALRYWKRHGCYPPGKNGPGPRPCPAPAGQSGPAALTDGAATRSRGRPAPALRWGKRPRGPGLDQPSVDPVLCPLTTRGTHAEPYRSPRGRQLMRFQRCKHTSAWTESLVHKGSLARGQGPPAPSQASSDPSQGLAHLSGRLSDARPEHKTQIRPDSLNSVLPGKGYDPTEQLVFSLCSFTLQSCLRVSRQSEDRNHRAAKGAKNNAQWQTLLGCLHTY